MSHFTVLVIGGNVDEQLAPYDEDIRVEDYSNGIVSDDDLLSFVKHYCDDEKAIAQVKELSLDELYAKFGEGWNGGTWKKNDDGQYEEMSTYNPKSKWDWYSVGGRWSGYFKLKAGAKGEIGESGVFDNEAPEGTADILLKGDIDFDAMKNEAGEEAATRYDIVFKAIKDTPINESWEKISEAIAPDYAKAREVYHAQVRVAAFKSVCEEHTDKFGFFSSVEDYNTDRETFIERTRNSAVAPFAVVIGGVWHEKGEMGWFGMSHNEVSQDEWNKKVAELIDSVPDDTEFTLVDCHT